MSLNSKQRAQLFAKYNGHCAYCGCMLEKGWHADHIKPIVRDLSDKRKCEHPENNTFENYNPSCPSCNRIKNSMSIEVFRDNISRMLHSLQNYSVQYAFVSRYGLVKETKNKVVFYFEKHKQSSPDQAL